LFAPWRIGFGDGTTDVEVGKEYVVYAIEWADGLPGYILCGEQYRRYPLHYPAELFEITDPRPSRHWVVGFQPARPLGTTGQLVPPRVVLGFPEWAVNWGFHYWVTEGREPELSTWQHYKRLIDAEAGVIDGERCPE
jgi:hypothetical protein